MGCVLVGCSCVKQLSCATAPRSAVDRGGGEAEGTGGNVFLFFANFEAHGLPRDVGGAPTMPSTSGASVSCLKQIM